MERISTVHVHFTAVLVEDAAPHCHGVTITARHGFLQVQSRCQVPLWWSSFSIKPNEDSPQEFSRLVGFDFGTFFHFLRQAGGVRNPVTCSTSVKGPAVKGALDSVAHHLATKSQVCAHVGTEGIQHCSLAVSAPEGHQFGSQCADTLHLSIGQICCVANRMPSIGKSWRKVFLPQGFEAAGPVVEVLFGLLLLRCQKEVVCCSQAGSANGISSQLAITQSRHTSRQET
mmetsp:Transcript_27613/g.60132  ORF Transcript_27613/g.60132 Transcript_27613/m.60132 type:complete len:229 (+) Transcript_27613:655-1341(+)